MIGRQICPDHYIRKGKSRYQNKPRMPCTLHINSSLLWVAQHRMAARIESFSWHRVAKANCEWHWSLLPHYRHFNRMCKSWTRFL